MGFAFWLGFGAGLVLMPGRVFGGGSVIIGWVEKVLVVACGSVSNDVGGLLASDMEVYA